MNKLIQIEWMKIIRQTKGRVLLVVAWIAALIVSAGNLYFNAAAGFTMIDSDQMPLTMISLLSALMLPLLAYIMSVESTSSDYRTGTIKYGLMAPVPRHQFYFAKFAALNIYNTVLLTGVLIVVSLTNVFTMTGNIAMNLLTYLTAYMITLLPMALVSLWGMLMGTFFSTGLCLGLGIIGVLALNVGQLFVPVLGSVSPLGYLNLYNQLIYGNTSPRTLVSVLLYLASYYIILITLNIVRIQRKEI